MPFCLRIRNCSGERTARHSSSDLRSEPAAAMATIPPRKPRLGEAVKKGVAETKRVVGVTDFGGKMVEGEERRRVEKMGLDLEEEIGVEMEVVLRILKPMAMVFVFTNHGSPSPFTLSLFNLFIFFYVYCCFHYPNWVFFFLLT